jgi:protein-S-isoprenylcysteine O-methyltransferase Ste14
VFLIDRAYIRVEEKMLGEKFVLEWEGYRKKTRRWL